MVTKLAVNLSKWTGFSLADIGYLIQSAPRRYKVFSIPKKRGGRREIAQPSRELKILQTLVVQRVLHFLPVHEAAHGYVSGRGIRSNALTHVNSNYLLKMDFRDFFPSIRPRDLRAHLDACGHGALSAEEIAQICNIVFWQRKGQRALRMCIGAPSSPFLSNTIMFSLDARIAEAAVSMGATYTRYADDLAFSCAEKEVLAAVERRVTDIVESSKVPRVSINQAKTVHISRSQRRMLTGIILNSTCSMSLGRERKRLIRAMVQRCRLGQLDKDGFERLNGLLAFAQDIEPEFAAKMKGRLGRSSG